MKNEIYFVKQLGKLILSFGKWGETTHKKETQNRCLKFYSDE